MKIHFVCRGNTFRSRLAEALARQRYPLFEISSSGIEADHHLSGHIAWYAQWIANKEQIKDLLHPTWRQTRWDELATQDIIVCLDQTVGDIVKSHVNSSIPLQILDIEDVQHSDITTDETLGVEVSILAQTREIFQKIRKAVEQLEVTSSAASHTHHP